MERLRRENARLRALLAQHGIAEVHEADPSVAMRLPSDTAGASPDERDALSPRNLSTQEKISLFRDLFHGRDDVFAVRWQSRNGRPGYSPACANEWKQGICEKPRIRCSQCTRRTFLPMTDQVIYDHLAGKHTIGVYPLLPNDSCRFLAMDFDKQNWRADAAALYRTCRDAEIPAALEISRSGNGAHIWIVFDRPVPARVARRLGTALISCTCASHHGLSLHSYDRLIPNQDTLPKGGFGNLIALPLQRERRRENCSVFVNDEFEPFSDQWHFLASLPKVPSENVVSETLRLCDGNNLVDVPLTDVEIEDDREPWKRSSRGDSSSVIPGPLPSSIEVTLADRLYIEKAPLPRPLANRIFRLAAFQNQDFYLAPAMRLPVWKKPRIISCAEDLARHFVLPRGCLHPLRGLCDRNGIHVDLRDERLPDRRISCSFVGDLRLDQSVAVNAFSQGKGYSGTPRKTGNLFVVDRER